VNSTKSREVIWRGRAVTRQGFPVGNVAPILHIVGDPFGHESGPQIGWQIVNALGIEAERRYRTWWVWIDQS